MCSRFPSGLKTWMRLLPRSATYTRPRESILMSCGSLKRAASLLSEPTPPPMASRNLPSGANLTMRLLPPRCPSATQMSPFGATTTPDGPVEVPLVVAPDGRLAEAQHHLARAGSASAPGGRCRSARRALRASRRARRPRSPRESPRGPDRSRAETRTARRRNCRPGCPPGRTSGSDRGRTPRTGSLRSAPGSTSAARRGRERRRSPCPARALPGAAPSRRWPGTDRGR